MEEIAEEKGKELNGEGRKGTSRTYTVRVLFYYNT